MSFLEKKQIISYIDLLKIIHPSKNCLEIRSFEEFLSKMHEIKELLRSLSSRISPAKVAPWLRRGIITPLILCNRLPFQEHWGKY